MTHYMINYGCNSSTCFHYCAGEEAVVSHIFRDANLTVPSIERIEAVNRFLDMPIEITQFDDVRQFFKFRKEYMSAVEACTKLMVKAQRATSCGRRERLMNKFVQEYNHATDLVDAHPEVWNGEV